MPELDTEENHSLDDEGLTEVDTRERTIIALADPAFEVIRPVIHVYEDAAGDRVEPEVALPDGIYVW